MIQLIDVSKTYRVKNGPEVQALDRVNITFGEKGLVFILGKSGAGKSTLLNVVGGLDRIDSGDIVIMGKSSKDFTQAEFDSYRNTYVGFIFQEYNILPDFTIGQNIALALQLQNQKGTAEEVNAILDEVDLHGLAERKPNELSGGQKQRVAIARALIKKPEIIMADEPTGALDSKTGQDIFNTLKKLAQNHLVICVSHDRDFAESFGDRVIEMKDGKVISDITKSYADTEKLAAGVEVLSPRLLSFQKGHVLTEEDVALLNRYLASADQEMLVSSDDAINTNVKAEAKIDVSGKKGTFSETTPDKVGDKNYQGSEFALKKSHLPFKHSLKLAFKSLKSKPIRLAVTILLTLISLTMFGVSATLASYSPERAFEGVYSAYNIRTIGLGAEDRTICDDYDYCYSSSQHFFSENETKAIAKESGLPFKSYPTAPALLGQSGQYTGVVVVGSQWMLQGYPAEGNSYDGYYASAFRWLSTPFLEVDATSLQNEYSSTLVAGRMPASEKEVLITDYRYEAYQSFGFSYYSSYSSTSSLKKEDCDTMDHFLSKNPQMVLSKFDTIAKTVTSSFYPIVGIVKTPFDFSPYTSLKGTEPNSGVGYFLRSELESQLLFGIADAYFGGPGFYDSVTSLASFHYSDDTPLLSGMAATIEPSLENYSRWYRFLEGKGCFRDYEHRIRQGLAYSPNDIPDPSKTPNQTSIRSAVETFADWNGMVSSFKTSFFWIGFTTACFSALLLATFIASSIAYQKRQIGILRAIGARGMDVYGIFYKEAMMVTLVSAFVAEILTAVLDKVLSDNFVGAIKVNFPLFQFNAGVFFLLLGLAVVTASLASFVPCLIISKKKPIDSINER